MQMAGNIVCLLLVMASKVCKLFRKLGQVQFCKMITLLLHCLLRILLLMIVLMMTSLWSLLLLSLVGKLPLVVFARARVVARLFRTVCLVCVLNVVMAVLKI